MIFVFLFRICFPLYDSPLSLCVLNYKMYGQTNPIKKPRVKHISGEKVVNVFILHYYFSYI